MDWELSSPSPEGSSKEESVQASNNEAKSILPSADSTVATSSDDKKLDCYRCKNQSMPICNSI